MKSLLLFIFLLSVTLSFAGNSQLQIGEKAKYTDVKMESVTGEKMSLDDLKGKNGLVMIFSCNNCPFVIAWEDRYNAIGQWAGKNGMGVALLNSNHQKRDGEDSMQAMKEHAKEKNYRIPYLLDDESLIANALGGQTTPHVFVFDKDFKLVYKGLIDDNYKSASDVKHNYLKDAIESTAAGKKIAVAETKSMGCSIKRKL